jgi:hypothetical protein
MTEETKPLQRRSLIKWRVFSWITLATFAAFLLGLGICIGKLVLHTGEKVGVLPGTRHLQFFEYEYQRPPDMYGASSRQILSFNAKTRVLQQINKKYDNIVALQDDKPVKSTHEEIILSADEATALEKAVVNWWGNRRLFAGTKTIDNHFAESLRYRFRVTFNVVNPATGRGQEATVERIACHTARMDDMIPFAEAINKELTASGKQKYKVHVPQRIGPDPLPRTAW